VNSSVSWLNASSRVASTARGAGSCQCRACPSLYELGSDYGRKPGYALLHRVPDPRVLSPNNVIEISANSIGEVLHDLRERINHPIAGRWPVLENTRDHETGPSSHSQGGKRMLHRV